jgi:hypothetical protein
MTKEELVALLKENFRLEVLGITQGPAARVDVRLVLTPDA